MYHLSTAYSIKNHPIPFNVQKINNGIEYNNGVFLILEPGYYRIATHLKSRDNRLDYKILKNSREGLIFTSMPVWDASSTYYVANLATFDMITIELMVDVTVGLASNANLVQIEKIY